MYGIHPDDLAEELGDGYPNEQLRYEASFSQHGWHEEHEQCKCHGNGYALSTLDQWHKCPYHGEGKRHPDDDYLDEAELQVRGVAIGLTAGQEESCYDLAQDGPDGLGPRSGWQDGERCVDPGCAAATDREHAARDNGEGEGWIDDVPF